MIKQWDGCVCEYQMNHTHTHRAMASDRLGIRQASAGEAKLLFISISPHRAPTLIQLISY